nr:hypothetical protein MACL_00001811 [Theileria orientalis]
MNGFRLPDPMNAGYEPYIDIEPRMIPGTNRSRQANLVDSRDFTPRNKPNYDSREDSVSAIRLNNHVNQAHTLGRNVYRSKEVTGGTGRQAKPNVNNSNVTRVTESLYNQDFEGRSVNYESIHTDLNSTILSNYTEGISSVGSFEYKYYRSNDPDGYSEANYTDKYGRESAIQPRSHTVKRTPERPSRPSKETIAHNKIKSSHQIVKLPSRTPNSQVDIIGSDGPDDDIGFYQLTRDELCRGLGSIGLALSKVFSLTGKGVLYLCSSITDSTEGLFETERNTAGKVAELHSRGDTNYPHCNCSINSNKDHRAIPDLHINYDTSCQLNGGVHKYTNRRHNAAFYDKQEGGGKYINDSHTYMDVHLLERGREQKANNEQMYYRNVNNKPSEYDKKHVNNPGYLNKANSHYDNFKIEFGEDLDYSNGTCIPENGYELNCPDVNRMNRNIYRDRELRRGNRMVERTVNSRFVSSYSIEEPFNTPTHNVKSPEAASVLSNLGNHDIRSIQSNSVVQKSIVNTSSIRPVEFNKEKVNSHGFDKLKTVEMAERTRKNTLDGTNFGRPCVSAYGADTNEPENKPSEKPNMRTSEGESTGSYKPPEEQEAKYLRTEIREQLSLKGDLMKELKDQQTDEIDDNTSKSFFSLSNNDSTSQSNYSRTKSVDGISIGDGSSNKSLDKISIAEYDTDKSVDSISMGEDESKDGRKKKNKKGLFSFGKKTK